MASPPCADTSSQATTCPPWGTASLSSCSHRIALLLQPFRGIKPKKHAEEILCSVLLNGFSSPVEVGTGVLPHTCGASARGGAHGPSKPAASLLSLMQTWRQVLSKIP